MLLNLCFFLPPLLAWTSIGFRKYHVNAIGIDTEAVHYTSIQYTYRHTETASFLSAFSLTISLPDPSTVSRTPI